MMEAALQLPSKRHQLRLVWCCACDPRPPSDRRRREGETPHCQQHHRRNNRSAEHGKAHRHHREDAGKSSNNVVNMMPNHTANQNRADESIRILFSREETCGTSTFEAILALLRQRICGPALKPSA
jgi:hypothetical protein